MGGIPYKFYTFHRDSTPIPLTSVLVKGEWDIPLKQVREYAINVYSGTNNIWGILFYVRGMIPKRHAIHKGIRHYLHYLNNIAIDRFEHYKAKR